MRYRKLIKRPGVNEKEASSLSRKNDISEYHNSPINHIIFLQRTIGNQAVMRMLNKSAESKAHGAQSREQRAECRVQSASRITPCAERLAPCAIQPKLRIGQPNDMYEQEADRVAEQVMRMPEPINNLRSALSALPVTKPKPTLATSAAGLPAIHMRPTVPLVARQPAPKPKTPAKPKVPLTVDNVDKLYGSLTEDIAKQVFAIYSSPLAGNEASLISAFDAQGLSAWIGLAIIKEESSFANRANNPDLDERNEANPFSVHFNTDLKRWPKGCGKNLLLIEDNKNEYTPGKTVKKECATKGFRLPTFAESAAGAAKIIKNKGFEAYREKGGYKEVLNGHLRDMVSKIKLKPK